MIKKLPDSMSQAMLKCELKHKVQFSEAEGQFSFLDRKRSFFICSRWHMTCADEPIATSIPITWEIHQGPGTLTWIIYMSLTNVVESCHLVKLCTNKQ